MENVNNEIKQKKIEEKDFGKKKIINEKDKLKEIKEKEKLNEIEENKLKEIEEREKKKEIEERLKFEEIEADKKEVVIELDEHLKEHIKDKKLQLNDNLIFDYVYIYKKISKRIIPSNLTIFYYKSFAIIVYHNLKYIFFYKLIQVEFNVLNKKEIDNKINKFLVCSSYELLEYCKNKHYNPYIEINNNKYEFNHLFKFISSDIFQNLSKFILVQDNRIYDYYKNEFSSSIFPTDNSELEPEKLSNFFELFFKFETKSNFQYWESEKRNDFIVSILLYQSQKNIYCFKICGPSGIGKSMTLFLISRYYKNFLYYNLKTIRTLKDKNDNITIQNILTESCKYLLLWNEKLIAQLSSLLYKNRSLPFFICLKEIIKFLIENKLISVIILDQFKSDYIDKKEYDEILLLISEQNNKNVKLLICSSTNDGEIREECIKSWKKKIFKLEHFDKKNQDYYFYIDELYNISERGNTSYEKIMSEFNYIRKYKNKLKYLKQEGYSKKQLNADLDDIKNRVEKNLKNFYKILNEKDKSEKVITMKMIESLIYLSLNIDEKIEYEKLEEFTRICSFKYYKFHFKDDNFIINYGFPYMKEIGNNIIDTHLEEFYLYTKNESHFYSVNSAYFKLFSIQSLKKRKLELPKSENYVCVKVNEIEQMKEFSHSGLDTLLKSEIYSNLNKYIIKKDDLIKENEENNKELKERELLLSLNNIIDYNVEDIEYHKLQYINGLKNEYSIFGNNKIGEMSIFIEQKKQSGKKLDFAYVYGPKENKTFIGFQMKAYDEESSHDCKFDSTKDNLKKELEPMIINIKYLMDMDIKSWHYVVIIALNKNKEEGKQYFKKLVQICENNKFEYIFYEPFENKFYNRNMENINKLILNQFSNLDNNIDNINPINIMDNSDIDKYANNFSEYMKNKKFNKAKFIEEGLVSLLNKKRKREENFISLEEIKRDDIKNDLNNIIDNIKIKFGFNSVKFLGAYEILNPLYFPNPKENHLFLVPSKEKNDFFIIFNPNFRQSPYYKYKIDSKINIVENNNLEVIDQIDPYYIDANINKKEKFYVFNIRKKSD